jgi:putative membrane protein
MKRKPISFLQIAAVTIGASVFALASVNAQVDNTSVSDNPHLRAKDAPKKQQEVKIDPKDKAFIQKAANDGVGLVADGKVAQARGGAKVKQIGSRMASEHSQSNKELQELAKKKGLAMDLSKGNPRPFPKEDFDQQYLLNAQNDIEGSIKNFQEEAKSGKDADLKGWANKSLPMLKSELSAIKAGRK